MSVSLGRRIWTWTKAVLGVLLLGLMLLMAVVPVSEYSKMFDRLEGEGALGTGKVLAVWDRENTGRSRSNAVRHALGTMTYTRHVEYEFKAASGEVVKTQTQFDAGSHVGPVSGASVEVLYHPKAPRVHRLTGYSQPFKATDPATKFVTGMLFFLLACYLIVRNGYRLYAWHSHEPATREPARAGGIDRLPQAARGTSPAPLPMSRPLAAGGVARASAGFGTRGRR